MSQFGGADFVYSVGADTKALDRAMDDTSKKAESAFGRVGTSIERSTAGARKFSGALSSTVGIVTGIGGALAFVAGVGAGVVSVYDEMAHAAERVAAANKKTADQTERLLRQARSQLGMGNDLENQVESVVGPLRDQVAGLRDEYEEMALGPLSALNPRVMYGGMVESLGGTVSRTERREFLWEQIGVLEGMIRDLTGKTESQFRREAGNRVQELNRETQLLRVQSLGYDDLADTLKRMREFEAKMMEMQSEADSFRIAGLDAEANAIERIIEQRRKLNQTMEDNIEQRKEENKLQKAMAESAKADDLSFQIEQRIRRLTGDEAGAGLAEIIRETESLGEQVRSLDISAERQAELLNLIQQLRQAQEVSLVTTGESQTTGIGRRFGVGVAGNVGSTVGAQVLGGTGDLSRQLDQKRNTTLASMDNSLKTLVRNSNQGSGPATFA